MLANAGLAQRLAAVLSGDASLLEQAIENQAEAVRLTPSEDPSRAGRLASLSVALGDRYRRSGNADDLRLALAIAEEAVNAPGDVVHETVGFLSNLGNLYHDRFLLAGAIADLDTAARLHLAGMGSLPDGHPISAALQNNAGITLSDRYDRLGDPADLTAAIGGLATAVEGTPERGRLRSGREVNLAVALARRFNLTGDPSDLLRSSELAQRAEQSARAANDLETAAAGTGALIDSLRLRWLYLDDDGARERLHTLAFTDEVIDERAPTAPTRLLRRALTLRTLGESVDQTDLRAVIDLGLRSRPSAALAAARQLAADALAARARGDRGASVSAREAAGAGKTALGLLLASNADRRNELSWRRDARGLAAIAAQVELLDGDLPAALEAYEAGHAVLLTRHLAAPSSSVTAPEEWSVVSWSTSWGGGAIVRSADGFTIGHELSSLTSERVERWVNRLAMASRIGTRSLDTVLNSLLGELAEVLAVLWDCVPDGAPVIWSGGGLLSLLPVAAVPVEGGVLGERIQLRQCPTPSFADWSAAQASGRELALDSVVSVAAPEPSAHPPLPGAALEATFFAPEPDRLTGRQATIEAVLARMAAASMVHFAGHAFTSASDPLANHLLLAGDTALYAEAIADLELAARLAILSACDTAAVGFAHAEEALGLAGAFHLAGVPGVVVSLWPVRDRATAVLMEALAMELRSGRAPSDALSQARETAREQGLPSSVWAAFVLSGA